MKKLILFSIIFLCAGELFAQWQPEVRLTNNPGVSQLEGRTLAANGLNLHLVWADTRDGHSEIYYKRSTDGGLTWGADTKLTNETSTSLWPAVAVSGSDVHVVWVHESDIYYKRSTNNGVNWGSSVHLTNETFYEIVPSITAAGSLVHIVWEDSRNSDYEIYYKRSTNAGVTWGADIALTNHAGTSASPSITANGQNLHAVWADNRDGNYEIYYKSSIDAGLNWNPVVRLTNDPGFSDYSAVTVSGSNVHVVWTDDRNGNAEIYYKRSTDNGLNWEADIRFTIDPATSRYPSITSSGTYVHVAWEDDRDGNMEVYYKRSPDNGINWQNVNRLTNNAGWSAFSCVTTSSSTVHIVYGDDRNGNYEVYYLRNPSGNPVGLTNNNSGIPEKFSLEQNYPNPFNPVTNIKFSIPRASLVTLKVYDIAGREVADLVNQNLSAGTFNYDFNASNLSSGAYFYRITTDGFTDVKKMMLVK